MEKQRLIEILTLVKKEIEENESPYNGMCLFLMKLFMVSKEINREEKNIVKNYMSNNRPLFSSIFFGAYWYPPKCKKPRINWINKQIKKLNYG